MAGKTLMMELIARRPQLRKLIESGELERLNSIQEWLCGQGVAAFGRRHAEKNIKLVFPEFVVDGRWMPAAAMIGSSYKASSLERPPKQKKFEDDNISGNSSLVADGPLRILSDGTELDEKALEFVDEYTLINSSETMLTARIMGNPMGRKYLKELTGQ